MEIRLTRLSLIFLLCIFLLKNLSAITVEGYEYVLALEKGNLQDVKKLIEYNNVNGVDLTTPLVLYAFYKSNVNLEKIEYLFSKGVDFDVKSIISSPPLIRAVDEHNLKLVEL